MVNFGMKTKKVARFGVKAAKAGIFGAKAAGRQYYSGGTMIKSPQLLAAVSNLRHGIEKMR
tara:strand:- start:3081 stop:3263 length:183 start_codon:yes stop_codon:yes gene_type:complete